MKYISLGCIAMALYLSCYAQNPQTQPLWDTLIALENNHSLTALQKLHDFYSWKRKFELLRLPQDSVYARILHKIGVYEFNVNKNYNTAIAYTIRSVNINTGGGKKCSKALALSSYYNLASYYNKLTQFNKALMYYDSTILFTRNFNDAGYYVLDARLSKAYIFFRIGDYEKSIEESAIGLTNATIKKDSSYYPRFLNQKAQSLFYQKQLNQSLSDVNLSLLLAGKMNQPYDLASAYKMKGYIYGKIRDFNYAESLFKKSIEQRIQTNKYGQIAGDYNDFGNFYRDSLNNFGKAKKYYSKGIEYALKDNDSIRLCRIQVNLGEMNNLRHDYETASLNYLQAFRYLKVAVGNSILLNPSAASLNTIGNKELISVLMQKKAELLLQLFKKNGDKNYLDALLLTALTTDSVLTQIRHEQLGEQSKLYWSNRMRDFFDNAVEACYLAGKPDLVFHFMEKSRAVLLNDRINELGASGQLPAGEAAKEQNLRIGIIEEQQKLATLNDSTEGYKKQQVKLFTVIEDFDHFIKLLETKYPVYYQYKYADKVNTIEELQKYLAFNKQSFVDYFMGDTLAYILTVTHNAAKMIRLSKKELPYLEISNFLLFCSDKQKLNNNYDSFASVSNTLYKTLFEPLHLQKGRVIICPDNFLIPFEALCTDTGGKNFLLNNYSFSYVYSARYLLTKLDMPSSKGNFIGFAPAYFRPYLNVPDLKQSSVSLEKSGAFFTSPLLLTNSKATRQNFINLIPAYTIVTVFSHAIADTTNVEPRLFMQDSMVYLSDLQLLKNAATQLVILSGCQTNAGKNATGEGIYSLARGFATAGVPSVAATMWEADELSIYSISEKFHENLSKGMNKDDALQKAKLYFAQNGSYENLMPYYWANMILIGNSEPIILSPHSNERLWIYGIGIFILILPAILIITKWTHFKYRKNA